MEVKENRVKKSGKGKLDRHFAVLRFLLAGVVRRYFCYAHDRLKEVEPPYFLLSNHNTDVDPVLVGAAAGCGVRFVASEHIAHKGFVSKLLLKVFHPILHVKGKKGIETTREILATLRDGQSVALFPEGNRSFYGQTMPIPAVTGKLARRSGVKLVTWRLEGGYMAQPRWGKGFRRGSIYGRLVHVYQPEELKAMTEQEVQRHIEEDLYEDAYATQAREKHHYRAKSPAEGLESALYLCPACGSIGTMKGEGTHLTCCCGHSLTLTPGMQLCDAQGRTETIAEMAQAQRAALQERVANAGEDEVLFSDGVTVSFIGENHEVIRTQTGLLMAYRDRFAFEDHVFAPDDLAGTAIVGRNALVVHLHENNQHVEIRGETFYSAIKYDDLLKIMKERAGE